MKFTDGYWQLREGVRALYPVHVYDVRTSARSVTAVAPTRPVTRRNDTVDLPLLTIELSSPLPEVIKVRVTHFSGGLPGRPEFPLRADPGTEVVITEGEDQVSLASGSLTARISRDDWRLEFSSDGRPLTASGSKALGAMTDAEGRGFMREQLDLGVGELVYGLGERFGPLVKNGQTVDAWNADGGTASEQAYKNVPFYVSNRGYGVFVNHPELVSFEIASETVSRAQFSVAGEVLEYFIVNGPTPRDVLRRYTELSGRPALPPPWSFGLWLSTSFATDYNEAIVEELADGMERYGIPVSVFHFDAFWMRGLQWCDFAWDAERFPDPPAMLQRLHERGLRTSVWISPYIAQLSPLFAEAAAAGYLLTRADGSVWQSDLWQAGTAVVDFTDPGARAWFAGKLRALLDMGVDCFKTDFGERIPVDVRYFDGSDPDRMHNFYSYLYNETVFELLREYRGDGEAVVFSRAATACSQRFPVHWGGDSESDFASMAESLRGGLSLAMSGFAFWSHDIGGFAGRPDPAVFKRWIPFGLLSSHSRLHGNDTYRAPWEFDAEAVEVLRDFTRLKARLMPYVYEAAVRASEEGVPMTRPMCFDFPDDPACDYLDQQFMLGDSLLVSPVFDAAGVKATYVPAGTWTDLRTGAAYLGPAWARRTYGFDEMPVLVRPGAVLPIGAVEDRFDYSYAEGVTLRAFEVDAVATSEIVITDPATGAGARFALTRSEGSVLFERVEGTGEWRVQFVGKHAESSVREGVAEPDPMGLIVIPHNERIQWTIGCERPE